MAETTRHREAFNRYWELGAERSIERLAADLRQRGKAPDSRTLYRWSSRFHWQARIQELERRARDAEDAERIAALREMQKRQAREALLLQQKGAQWLAPLKAGGVSAEAAIRAVVEGAKLERLVRGEATDRTDAKSASEARLEALSDAELDRLIDHFTESLGGEEPPQPA